MRDHCLPLLALLVFGLNLGRAVPVPARSGGLASENKQEKPYALIFGTVWGGCQDRRKEEIPTHIEKLPKEQPRPVEDRSPL